MHVAKTKQKKAKCTESTNKNGIIFIILIINQIRPVLQSLV